MAATLTHTVVREGREFLTMHRVQQTNNRHSFMPDWVPVFEPEDMAAGVAHCGTRHCALGWAGVLGIPIGKFISAYESANAGREVFRGTTLYNDIICKTDAERAEALNRAMRELGYTEIEDAD